MFNLDEIKAAFYKQEFFLEYMPTIRLADDCCVGAEALIRWRRGDSIVQPLEFIPLIENTPLIGAITYRVIELVGRDLKSWLRANEGVHVAINVPPELFGRGGLRFAAVISGLVDLADKLVFEVGERGIADALSLEGIKGVRAGGGRIALDDININDTNLLAMMHVHADIVKFEKSFADQMLGNDWSNEKMESIAALIHAGKFEVIVEGVETAAQAKMLKDAGIHMAQGWYFSHSLAVDDFLAYFLAHRH